MKIVLEIFLLFIASFNLLLARFALFKIHQPTTFLIWMIKVFVSALSPILFLTGLLTASFGWVLDFTPSTLIGGLSSFFFLLHIIKITRAPHSSADFEKAFDQKFQDQISRERSSRFLSRRYVLLLPKSPNPVLTQDIPFYTIPDSERQLLCDIWQPPKNVTPSGLAFIYLHGSAWTLLDKDYGTRTFFRHLTARRHVIMDVAYRLFPETDFRGMVDDTKHAIAWMKANAAKYGVNPTKVVIGGGSAGAHLALLAAYTSENKELAPSDLHNIDVSVRGVISLYGESDLSMTYYHTAQHLVSHSGLSQKANQESGPSWLQKRMGADFHRLGFDKDVEPGMLKPMLGGNPNEVPEAYARFSPVTHVNKNCPPTLLIHGEHDILAPLVAIKTLKKSLTKAGVPVATHFIPQTDHAFDLILPKISPSAHNAFYDVERFLAMLV